MKQLLFFLSILLLPLGAAQANDDELYDPAPPPDSAFVRVIQAASDVDASKTVVGGVSYGQLTCPALSNYRIVKGGTHQVSIGETSKEITIAAGGYFTVALTEGGKITLIKDELLSNPAKARVYFYNFSDAPIASLFAPEHKAAILDKVATGDGTSREVNALKLTLQVKAGDTVVQEFTDVQLKRRIGTTFLLSGKSGAYKALMIENEVER